MSGPESSSAGSEENEESEDGEPDECVEPDDAAGEAPAEDESRKRNASEVFEDAETHLKHARVSEDATDEHAETAIQPAQTHSGHVIMILGLGALMLVDPEFLVSGISSHLLLLDMSSSNTHGWWPTLVNRRDLDCNPSSSRTSA